MNDRRVHPTRRDFLRLAAASLAASGAIRAATRVRAADAPVVLDVAYAASLATAVEGPIKSAAAQRFGLELHGRASGASGLAKLIVGGSIAPDVFISITPSPMQSVLASGKAMRALPFARTEMAIAYAPQGRFAAKFREAGKPGGPAWYEVLQEPGLRLGRTDPVTDPLGRNAIYCLELAENYYGVPGLRERVLGADDNPVQIFAEATLAARVQSGQLDAATAYKIQPASFGLPYVELPEAINLGSVAHATAYARASLTLENRTLHPEPLVYYAAVLMQSAHASEATAFTDWLGGGEARAIFRKLGYDDAADAPALHA